MLQSILLRQCYSRQKQKEECYRASCSEEKAPVLRYEKCMCKALPGRDKKPLAALAKGFERAPLSTVQDTTDVNAFKDVMRGRCKSVPTIIGLGYITYT